MKGHLFFVVAALLAAEGFGQQQEAETKPPVEIPPPKVFETRHSGTFNGQQIDYLVRAGETYLRDDKGEPTAAIFSFAYLKQGVTDPSTRPVAFVWNGGPGSSSVWLHMGSMGPRRAVVPSDPKDAGAPPYELEDNTACLLDVTDLVFVDPVGTGYSRALGTHENKEFWGLTEDARSVAAFIRRWLTENRRWNSPRYLIGESFGTTRAAGVAGILEDSNPTTRLNGIVLISQALDYTGSTPAHDNLIGYITYLPTMAATAWYHKKAGGAASSLEQFLDEARRFAVSEYAPALLAGSGLTAEQHSRIRERLAYFTGLSEDYIEKADLRVLGSRFLKELMRGEGLAAGRLDSRYLGDDLDDTAERPEGDPASWAIGGAYTALLNDYLARELGVTMKSQYRISGGRELGASWRYRPVADGQRWEPSYVNTARNLSRALRRNSRLRVLVASGYFDFATPFFDAEYTFARHGILPDRVTMTYYEAGHMMYLHDPSRQQLMADIREFMGR